MEGTDRDDRGQEPTTAAAADATPDAASLQLRLYVAAGAPNSGAAIDNLRRLLGKAGAENAELEIIDVFEEPQRTRDDGVRMTPTLVKVAPPPEARVVGTLSDASAVRRALQIQGGDE